MKRWFLLLAVCPTLALAAGPKYTFPSVPGLDDEMNNIYHNISNPVMNYATASTFTVTGNLNVTGSSVTLPTGNISVGTISPSLGSLASGISILGAFDDIANARVVQIVQGTFSNQSNTTSASFAVTGLTVNITPQNASNRILVLASGILINVSASTIAKATIMRGSTNLGSSSGMSWNLSSVSLEIPCTMVYLDSPATTSQVTYAVGTASNNGGTVAWGDGTSIQSNIVAIEIGQ